MVYALLYVISFAVVLFVVYMVQRFLKGASIAKHLFAFGVAYDEAYKVTSSRFEAVTVASSVFQTCPGLRKLTSDEVEAAVAVLSLAPDPVWVVKNVVLRLDSRNMLRAFRDLNFLTKFIDVGLRRG